MRYRKWLVRPCAVAAVGALASQACSPDTQPEGTTATVTGQVITFVADYEGHSTREQFLQTGMGPDAELIKLQAPASAPEPYLAGSWLNATGRLVDRADGVVGKELRIADSEDAVRTAALESDNPFADLAPKPTDHRIAVILISFNGGNTSCSAADLQKRVFDAPDSIVNFYRESSFDQVQASGNVFGPVVVNNPDLSACRPGVWSAIADQQAKAQGIDYNGYQHRVYILPDVPCGWWGNGAIGVPNGGPYFKSQAWVNGGACSNTMVIAHELGHSLGMDHAMTPGSEYGDSSDIMGNDSRLKQPSTPHKVGVGWIPNGNVLTVTQSGVYTVAAGESNVSEVQALRIARSNNGSPYYVSYRGAIGFDATQLPGEFVERTSIHSWNETMSGKTMREGVVGDNESFSDGGIGLTVKQLRHDGNRAVVEVTLPGSAPGPDTAPPSSPPSNDPTPPPSNDPAPPSNPPTTSSTGLHAEYFTDVDLKALAFSRTDADVNFDWGTGGPGAPLGSDYYSVRWTGSIVVPNGGEYSLSTLTDDGVRVWIDDELVIDNWTDHPASANVASKKLEAGKTYRIKIEYYERGGDSVVRLYWEGNGAAKQAVPTSAFRPLADTRRTASRSCAAKAPCSAITSLHGAFL